MIAEPHLRVARLGLGTAQMGLPYGVSNSRGQVSPQEARTILARARSAGIGVLDTAAAYGNAEEVLGSALPKHGPFRIVTKILPLTHGLEAIAQRARRSVALLGGAPLDTLLVHTAKDLMAPEAPKLWRLMQQLRDEGLFGRIGISVYAADDPLSLARRYRPQVMQIPVSLLDQRCVEDGTLHRLKDLGIEVHARSIFLQGLLLMDPRKLPAKLQQAALALTAVRERIAGAGLSPIQAALGFVLERPEIDVSIVGVTKLDEFEEIIAAASGHLPAMDWKACALSDPFVLTPSSW